MVRRWGREEAQWGRLVGEREKGRRKEKHRRKGDKEERCDEE